MGMSDLANISIEIDEQLEKMTPAKGWLQCTSNHDNPKQTPAVYLYNKP